MSGTARQRSASLSTTMPPPGYPHGVRRPLPTPRRWRHGGWCGPTTVCCAGLLGWPRTFMGPRRRASIHGPAAARAPSRGRPLLIVASGLLPNRFPLPGDTSSDLGGQVQRGLWAAVRGDTATARRVQEALQASSADEVAEGGVSFTARVLAALLHARAGSWEDVIRVLAPALRSHLNGIGFSDESMWALARWLVADAHA